VAVEINNMPSLACDITCISTIIRDGGGQVKPLGFEGGSGILNTGFQKVVRNIQLLVIVSYNIQLLVTVVRNMSTNHCPV
jgi:hypothetical protein